MRYFSRLKRYIQTHLSCQFTLLIIVSLIGVMLPLALVYHHYAKDVLLQSEVEELLAQTRSHIEFNSQVLQQAPPKLEILARILQQKLTKLSFQGDIEGAFTERMERSEDGAWRNRRDHFDGTMQAGLFLPPDIQLDKNKKYRYLTVLSVFDLFGAATTSHPVFDNIWMLGHDRSEVIFDRSYPDFIYLMDADTDYTQTPWMQLASPQKNPDREAQWTSVLFDPVSKTWLVSVVYPLDINGRWEATLGMDLDVTEVLRSLQLQKSEYAGEMIFLLDTEDQFILAGDWQAQLTRQGEHFQLPAQETALRTLLDGDFPDTTAYLGPVSVKGIQYEAFSDWIAPMGWRFLRLVPTQEILQPLSRRSWRSTVLLLLTLLLVVVLFRLISRKLIVRPLLQVMDNLKAFSNSEKMRPLARQDELGQLNNVLIEVYKKTEANTRQLLDSEKRYRQLVTSVNEVLFQINQDKEWRFLSPVWRELSGYDLRQSLNQPAVEFFHIADQARLYAVMNELFHDTIQEWRGEVRLMCANRRSIWVTLSLNQNRYERGYRFLSGTIENSHYQHISHALITLVKDLEQRVMTGYCSLESILERATAELLSILDISLVWIKCCEDNRSQILSYYGDIASFLFEEGHTWPGIHQEDGPVMSAVRHHRMIRVHSFDDIPSQWQQRLAYEDIRDSLFVPFYLAGSHHEQAVIGLHSLDENVFDNHIQKLMAEFATSLRIICQMVEDQRLMRLHRTAVENVANAIMITDKQGRIEWVNAAFSKQTGYSLDEVIGKTPQMLNATSEEAVAQLNAMWETIQSGEVWRGEIMHRRKDGTFITVFQTVTPLFDDLEQITHHISVSVDVTERNEQIERITFLATHDELTRLPNRTLLDDRLKHAIAHAQRQGTLLAVLFVDIDHFKYINDSLGHQVGDDLLKTLAERLTSVLRQQDTVARFGGDEFVIVLPDISDVSSVKKVAQNLLQEIKKPFYIQEHELMITGSIGISLYPENGKTADELIQNADSAMYQAKEQGRNNSQFFTQEINARITRRLTLEKALRKAVEKQEFILFYQPKVDLNTRDMVGVEALVRWAHPREGLISPAEFIPLAEETGVITEIGHYVMTTACRQMKSWQSRFPQLQNMSINVSARQFWQDNFIEQVTQIIAQTEVNATQIEFELTESLVMDDMEQAIVMMTALREMGISLSIDDFGTGYSSLSYLQNLPVDVLKIDRSFVNDLTDETSDSAIIRSIIALADNFNLKVVAEGIEEAFQQTILARLGCQFGQGYLYSQPVNAEALEAMLAAQQHGVKDDDG